MMPAATLLALVNPPSGTTWDVDREVFNVKETDTHYVDVVPFMFTAAVVISPKSNTWIYDNRWCYHTLGDAAAAAVAWDPATTPEPIGWHRHPTTGRRRTDGDPEREYVAW